MPFFMGPMQALARLGDFLNGRTAAPAPAPRPASDVPAPRRHPEMLLNIRGYDFDLDFDYDARSVTVDGATVRLARTYTCQWEATSGPVCCIEERRCRLCAL